MSQDEIMAITERAIAQHEATERVKSLDVCEEKSCLEWSYSQMWCLWSGGFPARFIHVLSQDFFAVDEFRTSDQFVEQFISA